MIFLLVRNHRHLDKARLIWRMIYPLCRGLVVRRLCPENVLNKRLRVAIIERELARLDLHHHPVAGQKYVVRGRQLKVLKQRLAPFREIYGGYSNSHYDEPCRRRKYFSIHKDVYPAGVRSRASVIRVNGIWAA